MNLSELPDVFGVDVAADVCDVDPRTVRGAIKRGDLKAVRIGRLVKITKPALMEFLGLAATDEAESPTLRLIRGGDG